MIVSINENFLPSAEYHCPACEARRLDMSIFYALAGYIFQAEIMNSSTNEELKTLALTLINIYGNGENENNWNEIASVVRKLSDHLKSNSTISNSDIEGLIDPLIHVLENTVNVMSYIFLVLHIIFSAQAKELVWL